MPCRHGRTLCLQNVVFPQNFDRQYFGRNAYYEWMLLAVAQEKSFKTIALEAIGGTGNNYDGEVGRSNYDSHNVSAGLRFKF